MCSSAHKMSEFIYLSSQKAGVSFQLKDGFCYFHSSYTAIRPAVPLPINLRVRNMDILVAFSYPLFDRFYCYKCMQGKNNNCPFQFNFNKRQGIYGEPAPLMTGMKTYFVLWPGCNVWKSFTFNCGKTERSF